MNISTGTLLNNRYRITSVLGQGGMGAVYRAVDENLRIPVAVKENLFLTDEYSRQFQREANILAGLRHHSLPRVRDYFTLPGIGQYLVMDFIEGEDLRQRIERLNTLPEDDAVLIGAHICDALTHLHGRNPPIIHRDIKPGNIKVTPEGDIVLVDFGLAKEMHENQNTTTGARAMTPGYSPPEQYGTGHTDVRSDIYSLGATLYAALTGVIPEDSLTRVTGKTKLTPIRNLRPRINRKLAAVIEKALSVDPDDRYQTAEEMKQALIEAGNMVQLFQDRNTVTPPPVNGYAQPEETNEGIPAPAAQIAYPQPPISRPRLKRKVRPAYYALGIVLLAGLGAFLLSQLSNRPPFLAGLPSQTPALAITDLDSPTGLPLANVSITPIVKIQETSTPAPTQTPLPIENPSQTPEPTPTPLGGGFSQIAFSSNRTGIFQIWIMNADATNPRQLTNVKDGACQPAWAPDGSKIAFISPCSGRRDMYEGSSIYIMNPDGSDIQLLPVTPSLTGDFDPAWSPDGKMIAFTSLRDGRSAIFIFNRTNSLLSKLSKSIFPDKEPSWQPSGFQLTFIRQAPNGQVWVSDVDGSHVNQFSPTGGINNLWPTWSRDGQVIFYSQTSVDVFNPWLVGLRSEDRGSAREFRIPANPDREIGPVMKVDVSPDGMWLAYESWPIGNNHDIYIMSVTGANVYRLTSDPAFDFGPVWRPRSNPQQANN